MPIYEYDCPTCGRFETIQKVSDKPLKKCPTCQEQGRDSKVERLVSGAAFHLKGSGWYKTDYSSGGGSSTKSDKPAASVTESKSSDSKPAGNSDSGTPSTTTKCGSGCKCH